MSNPAPPLDEEWLPPVPDPVDLVVECDAMVSVFVAERYLRVEAMRQDALSDARGHADQLGEILERSLRLELAAALGVTEHAAGTLITEADALVNRYSAVLASLSQARLTPRHAGVLVEAMDAVEPAFRERLVAAALNLGEN